MQQGSFTDATPRHDTHGLVGRLNALADAVPRNHGLVIFVQHDGPDGDPQHPDQPGWRLLPTLEVRPGDVVVRKTSCDAFLHTDLEDVLQVHAIERLIISGCATDYCVDSTVRTALARGYSTVVPLDGHTTADRPHLSAVKIIEHHNAIWSDFMTPRGPALQCACSQVQLG
jgi:nicotinamidase-related amidase